MNAFDEPGHPPKRVLVCGGRDFEDWRTLHYAMETILADLWMFVLVEGDCRGADRMAADWAGWRGIPVEAHPADWTRHGKGAGIIRNQEMLDSGIDYGVAFRGGVGTGHMVGLLQKAGVPLWDLRRAVSVGAERDDDLPW